MNHIPVVHFPPNAKAIYYSSYGEDEANGLDIYIRRKLPDGSWGDPQPLPGAVNTSENEDFPYLHPSGNFLYFSSMGHNSMVRGKSNTGKSTMTIEIAVNAQKMGILPVLIITEMKHDWNHWKTMGFQIDDVVDEETGEVFNFCKVSDSRTNFFS